MALTMICHSTVGCVDSLLSERQTGDQSWLQAESEWWPMEATEHQLEWLTLCEDTDREVEQCLRSLQSLQTRQHWRTIIRRSRLCSAQEMSSFLRPVRSRCRDWANVGEGISRLTFARVLNCCRACALNSKQVFSVVPDLPLTAAIRLIPIADQSQEQQFRTEFVNRTQCLDREDNGGTGVAQVGHRRTAPLFASICHWLRSKISAIALTTGALNWTDS